MNIHSFDITYSYTFIKESQLTQMSTTNLVTNIKQATPFLLAYKTKNAQSIAN